MASLILSYENICGDSGRVTASNFVGWDGLFSSLAGKSLIQGREVSLVLTLNPGQRVFIGDDIEIWVRPYKNQQTKVMIKAPREIFVKRAPNDDKSDEFLIQEGNRSGAV